jgi:putative polyhydroxyalkanoate system protein
MRRLRIDGLESAVPPGVIEILHHHRRSLKMPFSRWSDAMPKIDIHRPHQLSLTEARAVVEQVAARMQEKFGMSGEWQGDTLRFSRSGVTGAIAVGGDAIHVTAELGMMLTPIKGMIEQEIRRKLDEHFG